MKDLTRNHYPPQEAEPVEESEVVRLEEENILSEEESLSERVTLEQAETALQEMEVQENESVKAEGMEESPNKIFKKIRKQIMLVVIGLAPLLVIGCGDQSSKGENKIQNQRVENTESSSRPNPFSEKIQQEREIRRKISDMIMENQKKIMSGGFDSNTNEFLKGYYEKLGQSVHPLHEAIRDEGVRMRMLDVAQKKGVDISKVSNEKIMQGVTVGHIPLSFTIDGKQIEVEKSDLTEQELKVLQGVYNVHNFNKNQEKLIREGAPEGGKYQRHQQKIEQIFKRLGFEQTGTEQQNTKKTESEPTPQEGDRRIRRW